MDGSCNLASLAKVNGNDTTISRSDIPPSTIPSNRVQQRKRRANKISAQEGLNAVKIMAEKLAESYQLTKSQDTAIQKSFQLLKEGFCTNMMARVRREKSRRSLQAFHLLRDVRHLVGLEGFLMCALALKPMQLHTMTEEDATNFPYRLKRWWDEEAPSSQRSKDIAMEARSLNDQIPYYSLVNDKSGCINFKGILASGPTKLKWAGSLRQSHSAAKSGTQKSYADDWLQDATGRISSLRQPIADTETSRSIYSWYPFNHTATVHRRCGGSSRRCTKWARDTHDFSTLPLPPVYLSTHTDMRKNHTNIHRHIGAIRTHSSDARKTTDVFYPRLSFL